MKFETQLTASEWALIFDVLGHFPSKQPLDDNAKASYRFLLRNVRPEALTAGLDRLVNAGQEWRPTAPQILKAIRTDASAPTFDEVMVLLFRRSGVLDVRVRGTTDSNPNYRAELYEKAGERLADLHPLVGGFVQRVGLERLRAMNIDDPAEGHWRRNELRETWTDFVDAQDGRVVAALAAGSGPRGLAALDPLRALGFGDVPAELGAGDWRSAA
jgi:hypothetical protein